MPHTIANRNSSLKFMRVYPGAHAHKIVFYCGKERVKEMVQGGVMFLAPYDYGWNVKARYVMHSN
jgi:hypothetical protein